MANATLNITGLDALKLDISARIYHALQVWDAHRQYRRTLNELSRLDARQLDDLGLCRADIEDVARRSAYGV